jgi:hypothetical protein
MKIKNQRLKIKIAESACGGGYFTLDSRFRGNDKSYLALG